MARRRRVRRDDDQGSVAIIVAASMVAVMGLAALGTDVGRLFVERQRLSTVVDAAALAGASKLPLDPSGAVTTVRTYLAKNQVDGNRASVTLSNNNTQVDVAINKQVAMTFARVIGVNQSQVSGGAAAQVQRVSGYNGAAPLGVPQADWQIGQQVHLKMDASTGDISPGNYMALALGKSGASTYEANLMNGYNSWIRAGDWVDTEPGNMAGPTVRAVNYRISQDPYSTWSTAKRQSPRFVVVPVLKDFNVNGKGQVNVIGFAMFYLEQGIDYGSDKGEVIGRFVRMYTEGEGSPTAPDFGLYAVKLIH